MLLDHFISGQCSAREVVHVKAEVVVESEEQRVEHSEARRVRRRPKGDGYMTYFASGLVAREQSRKVGSRKEA